MKQTQNIEVQIDTLVGPTHFYGGLAFGNIASLTHKRQPSNPKQAALQGLEKMKLVFDLGVEQLIFPPHIRPVISFLRAVGFQGSEQEIVESVYNQTPELLMQASSQSAMWTANAATVTPSSDTSDGKVHLTPANLISNLHRSLEVSFTHQVLDQVFQHKDYFVVHPPLPATSDLADEGAANHTRFVSKNKGVHLFVYGKSTQKQTKRYPARQSRLAQEAICRLHGINPSTCLFTQQNPALIDQGVFHNDVIAVGHEELFLYHEEAYVHTPQVIEELQAKALLTLYRVTNKQLSVADAVKCYLFNSQIVKTKNNETVLICPSEVKRNPHAMKIAQELPTIDRVLYVTINQSMKNGGGPACLRLRLPLTPKELAHIHQGVRFTSSLYNDLRLLIEKEYPEHFVPSNLCNPTFRAKNKLILRHIADLLSLPTLYSLD